jgi:hypothetical protein
MVLVHGRRRCGSLDAVKKVSRRNFGTLAGLLGSGLLIPAGCDRGTETEAQPKKPRDATPGPDAPPVEAPHPSLVDSYEPHLDRIHSASAYEALVSKSVAVELARNLTREATVPARQDILERDAFKDDHYVRDGELVLLGERDGWLIGFCYRWLVDFNFPLAGKDGFGEAELEAPQLTVFEQSFPLQQAEEERIPDRSAGDIAWYQPFGEHDAALVYLPSSAGVVRPHLGFADPLTVVKHTLENKGAIFGLEFVLMSPKSLEFLRDAAAREHNLAYFAAGMAVAALILMPLLGPSSAAAVPMAVLEGSGRQLVAAALPVALGLGRDFLLREDGFVTKHLDQETRVALLGVEFPATADTEGYALIGKFLAAVIEGRDEPGQFISFGSKQGLERGQLFVPDCKMCLNAELLSRGLARLDMDDQDVLRELPELVTAALSAVESKQNLAARWAEEDAEYVTQLRTLNRVVTG